MVNFYQQFIQSFNKIAILLILILKMTRLFKVSNLKAMKTNENKVVASSADRSNKKLLKKLPKLQNGISIRLDNSNTIKNPNFQTQNGL